MTAKSTCSSIISEIHAERPKQIKAVEKVGTCEKNKNRAKIPMTCT
jgi:hypothetical protein